MSSPQSRFPARLLVTFAVLVSVMGATRATSEWWQPDIPKVWDDAALADWATPLAGLNAGPTRMTAAEYYALPVENVRTYPVYYPGREPKGYWTKLQHATPEPLIEPSKLKSEADWIEAGRRVFFEADDLHLRTPDPYATPLREQQGNAGPGLRPSKERAGDARCFAAVGLD